MGPSMQGAPMPSRVCTHSGEWTPSVWARVTEVLFRVRACGTSCGTSCGTYAVQRSRVECGVEARVFRRKADHVRPFPPDGAERARHEAGGARGHGCVWPLWPRPGAARARLRARPGDASQGSAHHRCSFAGACYQHSAVLGNHCSTRRMRFRSIALLIVEALQRASLSIAAAYEELAQRRLASGSRH